MKRTHYWIIGIFIVLGVVAVLTIALYNAKKQMAKTPVWKPRPEPVETVIDEKGILSHDFRYLARLEAVAAAEIAPKISARVLYIEVVEGDSVEAGDLMARLDEAI